MERLYCPDFSSVFGPNFASPFLLSNIDTQIWPVFENIDLPQSVRNLLALESGGNSCFYHRKITINQLLLELKSSSIQCALFQALELDSGFGIPNEFAIKIAEKLKGFKIFCCIYPHKDGLAKLKEFYNKNKNSIAGLVVYPYYHAEYMNSDEFPKLIDWIKKVKLPLKLDYINLHIPFPSKNDSNNMMRFTKFIQMLESNPLIITPGNWNSIVYALEQFKYEQNIFLEINLRILGGQTPTQLFKELFSLPGFMQNWWARILLASGSPTLETSQLVRGVYEATEPFGFKQKSLLRMWGFRNFNRLFNTKSLNRQGIPEMNHKKISEFENPSLIHLGYDLSIQSFAITQLLSIQEKFDQIITEINKNYPNIESGTITLKSYHTTSSLIINEHEMGNYLDLHYYFVEESRKDSSSCLHTVAANENRADFNFPDHLIASTHGHRSLTFHIRNGQLAKGSRENIYILATFGPRLIKVGIDVVLHKS